MSSVRETITEEIKKAMKAKEVTRLATLRMIKAEIIKKETASGASDLDEAGMIALLQSMKKQRLDSISQFEKAGRDELAAKEKEELVVLESFLPAQLSDQDLAKLIGEIAAELEISDMKGMGILIKNVKERTAGAADGKRISSAVKAHLS